MSALQSWRLRHSILGGGATSCVSRLQIWRGTSCASLQVCSMEGADDTFLHSQLLVTNPPERICATCEKHSDRQGLVMRRGSPASGCALLGVVRGPVTSPAELRRPHVPELFRSPALDRVRLLCCSTRRLRPLSAPLVCHSALWHLSSQPEPALYTSKPLNRLGATPVVFAAKPCSNDHAVASLPIAVELR